MIHKKEAASFKVRPNALVDTDDSAMFASFNASVPEVDREDEIILPEDFDTTYWQANPVWLWAHDKMQLPIGSGYKPDGSVACSQSPSALILGCKFSQVNPNGVLTYGLYKEGTLKMVSVGFLSTKGEQVAGTKWGVNRPVTRILDPELVEYSCVPIGMNRGAMLLSIKSWDGYVDRVGLASVLDKGHLHGEKVPESMRRDLAEFAEPKRFKAAFKWVHTDKSWTAAPSNKIPKFSSGQSVKLLALHQPFGSPFMASIAKAPLTAGKIPKKIEAKTAEAKPEPAVETKAVDTRAPVVAVKADDDAAKPAAEEVVMSVGGQIFKAMMESVAGMCKGVMEMVPQSDSEDLRKYMADRVAKYAAMVGEDFESGTKFFPDYAGEFEQSATMAAEYAALEEEPDAAMNNTEEEAELQDEEKAEDSDDKEKPKEDDDEKSVGEVVTKAEFNDWHAKTFGEATPMEAFEAMVKPLVDEIASLKTQLAEHHEALSDVESVLTSAR